jgi:hypothetical protein
MFHCVEREVVEYAAFVENLVLFWYANLGSELNGLR